MCHICDLRPLDFDLRSSKIKVQRSVLLKLFYLDLSETLTVALFSLVLLAAFFLKNDDLIVFAVAHYRSVYGCPTADFGIFAFADEQRIYRYLFAFFLINSRNAKCLAAFDSKLLSACFDDCVTHYC